MKDTTHKLFLHNKRKLNKKLQQWTEGKIKSTVRYKVQNETVTKDSRLLVHIITVLSGPFSITQFWKCSKWHFAEDILVFKVAKYLREEVRVRHFFSFLYIIRLCSTTTGTWQISSFLGEALCGSCPLLSDRWKFHLFTEPIDKIQILLRVWNLRLRIYCLKSVLQWNIT